VYFCDWHAIQSNVDAAYLTRLETSLFKCFIYSYVVSEMVAHMVDFQQFRHPLRTSSFQPHFDMVKYPL
jgi:hypothetical protein